MKQTFTFTVVALLCLAQSGMGAEKKPAAGGGGAEHGNKAVQLAQQGAFDAAIEEFNKAVAANPKDYRLYNDRGGVYLTTKHFQEAVNDFSKAIELSPKEQKAYSLRGAAEIELGQLDAATADLAKALELKPNDPPTLERQGYLLYKQHNYDAALQTLNNALSQNPTSTLGLKRRADVYATMDQWANCVADLKQVMQLKPDDFEAQDRLDKAQARLQRQMEDAARAAQPPRTTPPPTPPPTPTPVPHVKILTRANVFIALGVIVVLIIIGFVVGHYVVTHRSD
ncbi:MAG: tetratricopeptide repeat protein [Chthoniobacterales bacterium]